MQWQALLFVSDNDENGAIKYNISNLVDALVLLGTSVSDVAAALLIGM